ncbi:hypothetical protein [Tabrizicola sp.]|uniref:hypothetical protein n=1 Tax=Tabrizicola sp. TaxID=2005166 RepID=UPI002FDC9866
MRVLVGLGAVAVFLFLTFQALFGGGTVRWNQRLTLVVETPQGEMRGSAVQRIDWEGTGAIGKALFSGVDPSSASVRVTGEALAVEVMPGRWLFALLKGGKGWQGEPGLNAGFAIAVPRGHFAKSAEGVREIIGFPKDRPVELPREAWPMLVTFDDVTKPETVWEVDPEDLAAVFGEGVRLKAVTLEVTGEAVTEGRVETLPFWKQLVAQRTFSGLHFYDPEKPEALNYLTYDTLRMSKP